MKLLDLAKLTETELVGNPDHTVSGVDSLETATSKDVSFLANPKYRETMLTSAAGVICVDKQTEILEGKNLLLCPDPSLTFQQIIKLLLVREEHKSGFTGIHPTAVIHETAQIGKDVQIGPYAVIDQGTLIGNRVRIDAHVSIGPGVIIGEDCLLYSHAVIREGCVLGNRVILQPGAIIGSCGFGYVTDAKGEHTKLEQLGIVVLEDDVEIGANTTIDRARFKETRISKGTKLDNLVQIGHNVILGPHNIIISQSGIAGSVKTGRNFVLGGQGGVVGHLEIGDFVMVATRGGVSKSMPKAGKYAGSPVMPLADYNRQQVLLRKIEYFVQEIETLKKQLNNYNQSH